MSVSIKNQHKRVSRLIVNTKVDRKDVTASPPISNNDSKYEYVYFEISPSFSFEKYNKKSSLDVVIV